MMFGFLVTTLLLQLSICQEIPDEKNGILEWYYNLNQQNPQIYDPFFARLKRQSRQFNNDFDSTSDEDNDDWYVFDEVGPEPRTPSRNNGNNQFGWSPQQGLERQLQGQQGPFVPNAIPSSTPRQQIPNAGPPRPSRCVVDCNARTTPEYNPVCGSDGVTYPNEAKMNCAANCGAAVQFQRLGRCEPVLPSL